jgi:GTP-binding protein
MVFRPAERQGFQVERVDDHSFRVVGRGIDRLVARFDIDNEEALAHLEGTLRRIGVVRALEEKGFEPGDDVELGGIAFEFDPDAPG